MKAYPLLSWLFMAALIAACTPKAAPPITATPTVTAGAPYGLWVLQAIEGSAIGVKAGAYILLSEGQCYLYAGCNHLHSPLTVKGEAITISKGSSTLMACTDMDYERQLYNLLLTVNRFTLSGAQLNLQAPGGIALAFKRQTPTDHLPGKTFVVAGLTLNTGVRYADDAPRQTLTFNTDGTLTGNAGCNTYRASYKIEDTLLHVQQVVATRRACPDKEKMQYESHFLQHLQKSPLTIEDSPNRVTLREADGKIVMTLREE